MPVDFPNGLTSAGVAVVLATDPEVVNLSTSSVEFDDFFAGALTSGQLGKLGWGFNNGTTTVVNAVAGHIGIVNRSTGATSGTTAYTYLGASLTLNPMLATETFDLTFWGRLNTNDASTLVRIGLYTAIQAAPADAIYIEKLAADTQWFGVTRASSVQTRTAALATVDTGWHRWRVRRINSTTIGFSIDGGTELTSTTNVPTAVMTPTHAINTAAAAAKDFDLDAFYIKITNLNR